MTDVGAMGVSAALPPLHNAWLGALTGINTPASERRATCGDCIMCAGVERSGTHVTFSPDVKCCSYVPHLANFLVGSSLGGPGRASVTARITRRAGVTPLGLGLSYADLRRMAGAQPHFGRSSAVVCPHFVEKTQGCGIWQTRNAVCSTWFCKHERGAVSQRFWHAVRDLLIAAEERVARDSLSLGGLPDEQVSAVLAHRAGVRETVAVVNSGEKLSESLPDDESADWYAQMWGQWDGREEEWFLRTSELVAAMSADDLAARMAENDHLAQAVRDRWDDLNRHEPPDGLLFSPGPGSDATHDVLRLVGYSPFDPLVLPAKLLTDLHHLDGRPIAQVREVIDPHSSPLDDYLLERISDFGVALPTGVTPTD